MTCQFQTPNFIYYSYITVFILTLTTAFIILFKDRKHSINRNAFYFILSISFWILVGFLEEVVHNLNVNFFVARVEILIGFSALFLLFFSYHFTRTPINARKKFWLSIPFLILIPFVPTDLNLRIFDAETCKFVDGPLVFYVYAIVVWYVILALLNLSKKLNDPITSYHVKSQIRILRWAIIFFMIWNIIKEEIIRITTLQNYLFETAPYFIAGSLFFISLVVFAIIKSDLFEFNSVLTSGFTITIWSFIFLGLIVFGTNITVILVSIIFYLVLLIIFLKM